MKYYISLFFRLTFLGIIILSLTYFVSFFILELINYAHFDWYKIFVQFPLKKMMIGGVIVCVASWLNFILQYNQSIEKGKKSLEILIKHHYQAEINEISPDPQIPFYKINGELFYNYAPFTRNINFLLSGIRKLTKRGEPKNIVIDLTDSSIKFEELRNKLFTNFSNKFNKIIIIDKTRNVIKIKEGDLLNINYQNLLYVCPCCDNHTLNRQGKEETCSICGWIDDPLQRLDPDYSNGDNKISLNEARLIYHSKSLGN